MVFFTASIFYDAERRGDSWLLALKQTRKITARARPPLQMGPKQRSLVQQTSL